MKSRSFTKYRVLPYNPKLKSRAKELRKAGYLVEVLFWNEVKNKQFKGLDFDRQKIIGNYIVDFFCASHNVVVEIDGSSHDDRNEYDEKRDNFLRSFEITVIRIPAKEILHQLSSVMTWLHEHPAFGGDQPVEKEI